MSVWRGRGGTGRFPHTRQEEGGLTWGKHGFPHGSEPKASDAHRPTISSGLTGTRVRARPVASRSAETIAAVETTVGGSPTPLTPYGASGSGSSTSSETT